MLGVCCLLQLLTAFLVFQKQKRRTTLSKIPAPREGEKMFFFSLLHTCGTVLVCHCSHNALVHLKAAHSGSANKEDTVSYQYFGLLRAGSFLTGCCPAPVSQGLGMCSSLLL